MSKEPNRAHERMKRLMRVALWTEIREALVNDFPDMPVPHSCPEHLSGVIAKNADWQLDMYKEINL